MKNKKQILAVVAFVAVIALFAGVYFATRPETAAGSKTVTITVVHKDGSEKVFTCHTDEEFLGPVLAAENLVELQDGMVTVVDGELADWNADQSYWALYVGEEYATLGADEQPVNDGDSFKWVYTVGF
ncbi:MAG: DUF4430 domain-containing protein [Eubacteriales bacterium]|nr:DUF4430 domain-containing protein [Eubacteriales bacterium]